ncbi:MAG TPA: glycosyltransferase family 4 protein [Thermoanaerobaculia bacterium]|jgi:glycosyltransferase involved in cell wall biosynthesis|nr:glycosyltransferase family 4 protein [Thermoanaerobaculia bacterium]
MRIVFVLHAPRDPRTAVYAYAAERGAFLETRGHQVTIWTHEDEPRLTRVKPRWWLLLFPLRIAARLAADPPDLVLFHSFAGWAFQLRRALSARLRKTRTIVQFHGIEMLYYRALIGEMSLAGKPIPFRHRLIQEWLMPLLLRISCWRADRLFCLNSAEREFLAARDWVGRERIEVVPNAAPEALLKSPPRSTRAARRLLFLGQWFEGKGIRYLIPAFFTLALERPEIELACVGIRAPAETVRAAFPVEVRDRVTVISEADRHEIALAFQSADLFVFPSLSEGSSLALLEAMAAGLPIVATPVGAAPDLLVDEESALLVPVESSEAIVVAVRRLLDDELLRARIGAGAREVAERHAWSRLREGYGQLIEEIGGSA